MTAATPTPAIRIERIGHEAEPVVVVDGFVADPDALVEIARGLSFRPIGPHYPGLRSPITEAYRQASAALLGEILRTVFGYDDSACTQEAYYSLVTTPAQALQPIQRLPHFDGVEEQRLAVVHFLCGEALGGTSFYRHRSSGFETVNAARYSDYAAHLRADMQKFGLPAAAYIAGDTPIFERSAHFEARYNRALIYRGKLLHCAHIPSDAELSPDPARGRLTVNSFLAPLPR